MIGRTHNLPLSYRFSSTKQMAGDKGPIPNEQSSVQQRKVSVGKERGVEGWECNWNAECAAKTELVPGQRC